MKLFGKRVTAPLPELHVHIGVNPVEFEFKGRVTFTLEADGSYGPCYLCAAPVTPESDFAYLIISRVNPKGDPIHAVCHGSCAERARRI